MKAKTWLKAVLASLIVAAPMVLWNGSAQAAVGVNPLANFPATVPGQTMAPAVYTITNNSDGAEAGPGVFLTFSNLRLVPSCGSLSPCTVPDLNVFQLQGPFTVTALGPGAIPATCPTSYTISPSNPATGELLFTPTGPAPVLFPGQSCRINFFINTLRVPSTDVNAAPGVQTAVIGSVDATTSNGAAGSGVGNSFATVNRAPATIATQATPQNVDVGRGFADRATVTGVPAGPTPTGTVSFQLFGPSSPGFPTCTPGELFDPSAAFPAPPPSPLVATAPGAITAVADSASFGVPPRRPATPGNYVFIATYPGDANYLPITSLCADPLERVRVQSLPSIAIVKTARPTSLPEPGGTFEFDVVVTNTSAEPIVITALTDRIGVAGPTINLNGRGNCAIGAVLAPGGTYSCTFPGPFTAVVTGPVNPSQTDTVTVTGADMDNPPGTPPNIVTAMASAVVTITPRPTIVVVKTANPLTRPEPGGVFTFPVEVRNTTVRPVTITTLTDTIGTPPVTINLNLPPAPGSRILTNGCVGAVGTVLAADPDGPLGPMLGGVFNCSFTANYFSDVAGSTQVDVVRAVAVDTLGLPAEASDDAVVTVTDVLPTILVDKTATPLSRPVPGGVFTFPVRVTNTSVEPVRITELTDTIGTPPVTIDLNLPPAPGSRILTNGCVGAVGTVLAADPDGAGPMLGGVYNCSFTANFSSNVAGSAQTDVVRAVAVDSENNPARAQDDAVVTVTALPTILVDKAATPATRLEPGGVFTFNVVVTNTSARPVTITTLTDTIGTPPVTVDLNLANPGSRVTTNGCAGAVGRSLAADPDGTGPLPGGVFTCSFTANFTGVAGASQTDTVTAVAIDNEMNPATDTDDAIVSITNLVPTVVVEKTATPNSLPEPGGNFTFRVVVTNTSVIPVRITSLVDSIYGNLNLASPGPRITNNTCVGAVGTLLAASGGMYTCTFTGRFTGVGGNLERDVVTVVAADEGGETTTANDDATITITPGVVVSQNLPQTPTAPTAPNAPNAPNAPVSNNTSPNRPSPATGLAKTGASVANLVALAVGLLVLGGVLLLTGSRWAPTLLTAPTDGAGGLLGTHANRRRPARFRERISRSTGRVGRKSVPPPVADGSL